MITEGAKEKGVRHVVGRWMEYEGPARAIHLADGRVVYANPGDWVLIRRVNGEVVCLWHQRRIVN